MSYQKTPHEVSLMYKTGQELAKIKQILAKQIKQGVSAMEIEILATALLEKTGGKPSFKMVPGYSWSTCINVNDGIVHGIPGKEIIFRDGDIVSLDVGLYKHGFHTDTSISKLIGDDKHKSFFLETGRVALSKAISKVNIGNKIFDISKAIEDTLKAQGLNPVESLTGHGVGKNLHEAPFIPGFVSNSPEESFELKVGVVLAIEVIYTEGSGKIKHDKDGWTIRTKDGKISGLFEETVAVTANGPVILTEYQKGLALPT